MDEKGPRTAPPASSRPAALAVALAALSSCGAAQASRASTPPLRLVRKMAMPGVYGRLAHLAFSPKHERLFVAALRNGSLEVLDLEQGRHLRGIRGLREPHGIVFVPGLDTVVAACGDGAVVAFAADTLAARGTLQLGAAADHLRVLPDGDRLLIGHGAGALAIVDAKSLTQHGNIELYSRPESFQIDWTGERAFVNVAETTRRYPDSHRDALPPPSSGLVHVVNLGKKQVTSSWHWPVQHGNQNLALAIDGVNQRVFVACRTPPRLLAFEASTGRVLSACECIGDADDLFVDSESGTVLVLGGAGSVDVFETADFVAYRRAARVPTAPGARTGLLVPERRRLYVAAPRRGDWAAEVFEYELPEVGSRRPK